MTIALRKDTGRAGSAAVPDSRDLDTGKLEEVRYPGPMGSFG